MNLIFHEPLNWLSTRVLSVQHCLAGGHATLLASGPTFRGEILRFLGLRAPSNKVSLLKLPGRPRPPCRLREPLQIADEPHICPATDPLKEVDGTNASSREGLGAAIAVSKRIHN
jgi:hypothetical protein